MTAVARTFICLAAMITANYAINLTVVDPMDQVDITTSIHTKTDFCNALKKSNIEDFRIIYMVEESNEDNVNYFNTKLKEAEEKGIDLHTKQFVIKNNSDDSKSFLLCLQTVKSQLLKIDNLSKSQIDEIFAIHTEDDKKMIVIFEDATSGNFDYEARIMADEDEPVADHNPAQSEDQEINNEGDHSEEEHQEIDSSNHSDDKVGENKVTSNNAEQAKINLSPAGLMGVAIGFAFVLILVIYFNLLMQSGDFNPKFIKEKLPQGKEY